MGKTLVITSARMAGWLLLNGLKLLAVKPDLKNPERVIFIFKDTPLLRRYMELYPEAKAAAMERKAEIMAG